MKFANIALLAGLVVITLTSGVAAQDETTCETAEDCVEAGEGTVCCKIQGTDNELEISANTSLCLAACTACTVEALQETNDNLGTNTTVNDAECSVVSTPVSPDTETEEDSATDEDSEAACTSNDDCTDEDTPVCCAYTVKGTAEDPNASEQGAQCVTECSVCTAEGLQALLAPIIDGLGTTTNLTDTQCPPSDEDSETDEDSEAACTSNADCTDEDTPVCCAYTVKGTAEDPNASEQSASCVPSCSVCTAEGLQTLLAPVLGADVAFGTTTNLTDTQCPPAQAPTTGGAARLPSAVLAALLAVVVLVASSIM